ncbi:MAG: helix-turn-helix transcriptional regulator [Rhodobacteraceae bacterium]|nr:helix-turn-helix transcriptional regulator [Paracoccaceae bacterium]
MPQLAPPFPCFAQRLFRLRRATGVKQLSLALEMGVNQTTVSRWEAGQQTPSIKMQQKALAILSTARSDDTALRRLVENAGNYVHLVDDATHVCLAYSPLRARSWNTSQQALLGVSLWQFATDEIQQAEADLEKSDWWSAQMPTPQSFQTSRRVHDEITISAGGILWERLYLSDGTPVRLVTGV